MFALFNVVWATLFLERWKQREAELAYRWGTLDTPAESLEEPRPQFRVFLLVLRVLSGPQRQGLEDMWKQEAKLTPTQGKENRRG
ncbi:hypothetical protein DPEC_G00126160 [Dallia pectoralis]|uniref:Uncharacterized protein n=1 Tax=Dallia pectoralis TaxID=75939 RepID=A0ACC2GS45_DALPE|nr:hypothetical protein DPEC_G00126160 [Dallia pectoralis]